MSVEHVPSPATWTEVESPPHIVTKYDPHEPTLFEHDEDDVAVHVLPVGTSSPHDEERWRVGFVRGGRTEMEAVEPIATDVPDRESALHLARDAMEVYDERGTAEMNLSTLASLLSVSRD
jgi:hypothetical protein